MSFKTASMVKITAELVRQRSCRYCRTFSLFFRTRIICTSSHTHHLSSSAAFQRAGSAAFAAPDSWAAADEADGVGSSMSAESAAAAPVECDLHMCQLAAVPAFDEKRLLVSVRLIPCSLRALHCNICSSLTHTFFFYPPLCNR